jgi:hypothetical protein
VYLLIEALFGTDGVKFTANMLKIQEAKPIAVSAGLLRARHKKSAIKRYTF